MRTSEPSPGSRKASRSDNKQTMKPVRKRAAKKTRFAGQDAGKKQSFRQNHQKMSEPFFREETGFARAAGTGHEPGDVWQREPRPEQPWLSERPLEPSWEQQPWEQQP